MTTTFAFAPRTPVSVAIDGTANRFPVHRIYCVGRNYAEHTREMGGDPAREPPIFFCKPADAVIENDAAVPYPPRTHNLHHEVELVLALGRGGHAIAAASALEYVFGYAVGNDFTRRDLQQAARDSNQPWDTSKGFDHSAGISAVRPATRGHIASGRIWLKVNGTLRQQADIGDMIWKAPEIIAELSTLFELAPGDLIYTGTPAGVGRLQRGDRIEAGIEGVGTLTQHIE
jgi:fumarylpyruvate hydrolase